MVLNVQQNRPQDVTHQFGVTMRQHRDAAGISQRKLSEVLALAGVRLDPSAVTRIEKGQREPKLAEAVAISEALGFNLEDLKESRSSIFYTRLASVEKYMTQARKSLKRALWHAHAAIATAPADVFSQYSESFDPRGRVANMVDLFREEFENFEFNAREQGRPRKSPPSAELTTIESMLLAAVTEGLLDEEPLGGIPLVHPSELEDDSSDFDA